MDPHIMETIAKTHAMEKVALRQRIAELEDRLREARSAIALMPPDALGTVEAETDCGPAQWFARDEMLHHIDQTLGVEPMFDGDV